MFLFVFPPPPLPLPTCTCSKKFSQPVAPSWKVFGDTARNKPPLFSHLYFISVAWVPSEPTPRPARKYLNFNRLSLYCKTLPPWHAAILHANLKLTSCKNLLCNYCAQKKNTLYWVARMKLLSHGRAAAGGVGGASFKLKCRADHPALPWLCCAFAETRWDLDGGRADPGRRTKKKKKRENNINETEYLNEFIRPPSRSTNATAEATLRSRTSPDTSKPVISRRGDRPRVLWYAAVKSPSKAVRVICYQLCLA